MKLDKAPKGFRYIYGLIDPRTSLIKYIGQSYDPYARLKAHIIESNFQQLQRKEIWLYELRRINLRPFLVLLDLVTYAQANEREKFFIKLHKNTVFNENMHGSKWNTNNNILLLTNL